MTLSGATTQDLGSGSDGNEGVLRFPKNPALLEPHQQIA